MISTLGKQKQIPLSLASIVDIDCFLRVRIDTLPGTKDRASTFGPGRALTLQQLVSEIQTFDQSSSRCESEQCQPWQTLTTSSHLLNREKQKINRSSRYYFKCGRSLSPSARLIRTNARDTARHCNFITIMSTPTSSRNIQRRRQKEKDCEHDHDIRRGLSGETALYNGK